MKKNELLPCPFCGSEAELMYRQFGTNVFYDMKCTNTDCYLSDGADWCFQRKKEAIDKWNKRKSKFNIGDKVKYISTSSYISNLFQPTLIVKDVDKNTPDYLTEYTVSLKRNQNVIYKYHQNALRKLK